MRNNADWDHYELRAEVLQKVGRNLINLAKIERGLKFLLVYADVKFQKSDFKQNGEGAKDNLNQAAQKLKTQTLGHLVNRFTAEMMTPPETEPVVLEKSVMRFKTACFWDDPQFNQQWRDQLKQIVQERNDWIHHRLGYIDTSDLQGCRALITELDAQNIKLLAHLEFIRDSVEAMEKMTKLLSKSPELIARMMAGENIEIRESEGS